MSSFSAMYRGDGENTPAVLQAQGKWFWRCSQALCHYHGNLWSEFALAAGGWGSSPCRRPAFVPQAQQGWPQKERLWWGRCGGDARQWGAAVRISLRRLLWEVRLSLSFVSGPAAPLAALPSPNTLAQRAFAPTCCMMVSCSLVLWTFIKKMKYLLL